MTVEHADGTTTIEDRPERIVTLGLQWTTVVALNTPTPMSIPHALDLVRPALEAAAA